MKTIVLVCLILASAMAAGQPQFKTTLTNLVNMQARAVDAVQSALDLLKSLKQANVDAQRKADELNKTQELERGLQIQDLTTIADNNKAAGDQATATRENIQEEIRVTQEYLVWITNRRNALNQKRENLREQRCRSNLMFISALKEHDEALEVIRWLREDIIGVINGSEEEEVVDFAQIEDSAQKLSAYAHLFKQNQLKEFAALQNSREDVDAETAEWDERADDNEREALSLERSSAGTEQRDVGNRLLDAVDRLEEHLVESIKDLEASEIRAAWDLSQWQQDAEAELVHLDNEQAVKSTYIDKLLIAVVGAQAREDKAWEVYFESASTLNTAIDALNELRAWYAQEKARRDEENAVLDEVIAIFLERVDTIDKGMRQMASDHNDDGQFNEEASDLTRRTDAILESDGGSLAENVAAESLA